MSGEGAAGLAVVAVIGGGVLVASRLAVGATGLMGAGLAAIGDRSEAAYQRWVAEQQVAAVWECAAREVIVRNSRIAVVAARSASGADWAVALPEPYVLAGQPVEELRAWLGRVDATLTEAEEALATRAGDAVRAFLGSVLAAGGPRPGAPTRPVGAAEALDRFRRVHAAGTVVELEVGAADVARIMERLVADAVDDDRAAALAAAAAVLGDHGADRRTRLDELRERVRRANAAAATARTDRETAATWLQALATSEAASLRARLSDVVAGRRPLGSELRAEALHECEQVRDAEEEAYIRRCATAALAALGYTVDGGFETRVAGGGALRLVRDDWNEHAVGVVLDGKELRTSVIRTAAREDDDAVRVDVEREEQWCEAYDVLRAELAGAGLDVKVTHLKHPGERPVPVAARAGTVRPARADQVRTRDGRR